MNAATSLGYQSHRSEQDLELSRTIGFIFVALALGGITGPFIPALRLETGFALSSFITKSHVQTDKTPLTFGRIMGTKTTKTPSLIYAPDGSIIKPVNRDFSIVIPKIGVNAPVIANVDPTKPDQYDAALLQGVAQASTSFTPDQNGTTYLFSHSTNYDWFVKDLNAVFYLLKNLKTGDYIVLYYKGQQYTYQIRETKIVSPHDISYLVPQIGKKSLILQTCWPPGSTTERLLVFADLTK